MESLLQRLNDIGFERTRRAVAALALSLFVFLYLLVSVNPPGEGWRFAFLAMSACYGVAFMGVAAEWFWGRWFAAGLGWSGIMVGVASIVMIGWSPVLGIYGGLHGLVVLALAGKKMATRFDLQPAWRERYGMDEFGVARLRKTVTRASASLPSVILWALAPKDPGQGTLVMAGALLTGLLAVSSVRGLIQLRTWGLAGLVLSSVLLLAIGDAATPHFIFSCFGFPGEVGRHYLPYDQAFAALYLTRVGPTALAALLAFSVLPFAGPAARYLKLRR